MFCQFGALSFDFNFINEEYGVKDCGDICSFYKKNEEQYNINVNTGSICVLKTKLDNYLLASGIGLFLHFKQ